MSMGEPQPIRFSVPEDGFDLTLLPEAATDSKGTMALLALHHARPRACVCTVALLALNSLVRGNHLARLHSVA